MIISREKVCELIFLFVVGYKLTKFGLLGLMSWNFCLLATGN